jgi:hypothetical protein
LQLNANLIGSKSRHIKRHKGLSIPEAILKDFCFFGGTDFDNHPIHFLTCTDQTFSLFEIVRFHNDASTSIPDFVALQSVLLIFLLEGLTISSPRTPFNSFRALAHLRFVSRDSREIDPHDRATFDYIGQNLIDSGLQVYSQSRRSTFLTKIWIHQRWQTTRSIVAFRNDCDLTRD